MAKVTQHTDDPRPMAITLFHPTHGTRKGHGIVVLDNPGYPFDSWPDTISV